MATMKMPCAVSSGSGSNPLYVNTVNIASSAPSWSSVPVEPNIVLVIISAGSDRHWCTNVNPSTLQRDDTTMWHSTNSGGTWSVESGYSWNITSDSVAFNKGWTSATVCFTLLVGKDVEDFLLGIM